MVEARRRTLQVITMIMLCSRPRFSEDIRPMLLRGLTRNHRRSGSTASRQIVCIRYPLATHSYLTWCSIFLATHNSVPSFNHFRADWFKDQFWQIIRTDGVVPITYLLPDEYRDRVIRLSPVIKPLWGYLADVEHIGSTFTILLVFLTAFAFEPWAWSVTVQ